MMTVLFTIINSLHPSTKAIPWQHFTGKKPKLLVLLHMYLFFSSPKSSQSFRREQSDHSRALLDSTSPVIFQSAAAERHSLALEAQAKGSSTQEN